MPKIKAILSVLRPGVFIMFSIQGPVGNEDRMTSMRLFAQEVMPALKEHAKVNRLAGSVPAYAGFGFTERWDVASAGRGSRSAQGARTAVDPNFSPIDRPAGLELSPGIFLCAART